MKDFKDIFVTLRKEKEYSQTDMAKMLNVSKSTVGMWELGKRMPQRATLESIADIFNVDMDYLCGRQVERQKFILIMMEMLMRLCLIMIRTQ